MEILAFITFIFIAYVFISPFVEDAIEKRKTERYYEMVYEEYYKITKTKWPGYFNCDFQAYDLARKIVNKKLYLERHKNDE